VLGCHHDGAVSAHDLTGLSPVRANWLILELAAFETWLGDLDTAAIHLQDAAMYVARADVPLVERAVLSQRAVLELVCGSYQSARASADAALALRARVPGPPDITDARAHLARGWAALQELDLPGAGRSLHAFEETPRELLDPLLLVYGRLFRGSVLAATGDLAGAQRLLDHRGEVPERLSPAIGRDHQMLRMIVDVASGDLAGLEQAERTMRATGLGSVALLAEAWRLGLVGQEQRALRVLDGAESAPDNTPALALTIAVARAALLHRSGTSSAVEAARAAVPDLLSRAFPQRLLLSLALGALISPGFLDLIAANARSSAAHPFAAEAYAVIGSVARPFPDVLPRHDPLLDQRRSTLSPREQEVLEQLALGGGNADLARALFVSENTVKTHLASIYRKLEVERRVDALRVARQRGLI
jgi:ATP/maltotriose-dependent transcriptional regulator MalT